MAGAFDGIRILDFTQGVAGPMACALLADMDADVVKVEPPAGDRAHNEPGYLVWNRNKRRVTLDLSQDSGRDAARDLIDRADIAVFDLSPGQLEEAGFDEETLRVRNPSLIHLWVPPYGRSGLWSYLPADHLLLTAVTGVAFRQASYADQPVHLVTPLGFYAQAITAASAMSTALYERAKSGVGQGVSVSGLQGLAAISNPAAGAMRRSGPGYPMGAGSGYRTYRCGDGQYLFLGALFAHFFVKTIEAMGFGDSSAYPRGADTATLMEMRFMEKSRDEWVELFRAHDVPAGPVISRTDWFSSDIVANNKMRVVMEHPELGPVAMPGAPLEFSDTPAQVRHFMKDVALADVKWTKRRRAAVTAEPPKDEAPLKGVTVLDLGTVIAGAYATGLLASLGANVIKVEPMEGDPFRGAGLGFASYSRGKRGLGLDLKLPAGRELFLELVRNADIVLDNYRFGVRARLGVDYAALRDVNPRIISCTINAYGSTGAYAKAPGFDAVIQAHSGIMHAQGGDGSEPVMQSITVNDVGSASLAAFGVLAALYAREKTGRGQEVLTSLANTSITMQSGEMVEYEGRVPNTPGGRDVLGAEALRRLYPCRDHWVAIACTNEMQFAALCVALGHEEWITAFGGKAIGADRDGALAKAIGETLRPMGAADALTRLLEAGVPAVPAIRGEHAYEDPWLWENDYFETYYLPMHGEIAAPPGFVHWSRSRAHCYERPVPEIGEHTIEVLREFGVSDERIMALFNKRVVFG